MRNENECAAPVEKTIGVKDDFRVDAIRHLAKCLRGDAENLIMKARQLDNLAGELLWCDMSEPAKDAIYNACVGEFVR